MSSTPVRMERAGKLQSVVERKAANCVSERSTVTFGRFAEKTLVEVLVSSYVNGGLVKKNRTSAKRQAK